MQPLGSLFVVGALLLTAGCHGHVRELYPPLPGEAAVTIYVVGHGWHPGIVIRRDDIPAEAWPEHRRSLAARFLEVGWGDRAFYESPEAGVRLALKAAVPSAPGAAGVRVWEVMSRGRGPRVGRPLPEGANVA